MFVMVYRCSDGDVYRKPTGKGLPAM